MGKKIAETLPSIDIVVLNRLGVLTANMWFIDPRVIGAVLADYLRPVGAMLASPRLTRFDFSWAPVIVDSRQCWSQAKDDFDMAFQAINIRRQIPIAHRASFGGSLALLLV